MANGSTWKAGRWLIAIIWKSGRWPLIIIGGKAGQLANGYTWKADRRANYFNWKAGRWLMAPAIRLAGRRLMDLPGRLVCN